MPDEPIRQGNIVAGDSVGGDKITVGNISGSYTAIGAGAQVIVTQVQEALSAVDELDKSIQAAERRLAQAIQKKVTSYTQLAGTSDVEARGNPYKALLDYKVEDTPFFYGRTDAIQAMRQKMQQSRLTILHSDSGSGKTSLLQAGLASRLLAEGQFPLYLRPYDQPPAQFIKKAFLPDYGTQEELKRFGDEQMTLHGFLERVSHYLGGRRLVIFLDQFEEFFSELSTEQQADFAAKLRECVQSDLSVWWVLALRKEYFSDLRLFQALKPFENEYFLPTFRMEEAQEVIVEPAALKGVVYEVGLVDQILDDIRGQSEAIPPAQVQLVCHTLFNELVAEADAAPITYELYNKPRGRGGGEPGAKGILTSHLSRVLDRELTGKERKVAGRVLEALVTSDIRRVLRSRASLENSVELERVAQLDEVLKVLYDNRLVRRELDENDEAVYELAHDYLLNEIELDPETQARKAAQELLAQEVHAYQLHGTLLSKEKFDIINSQRDSLSIDETAAELLDKSEATITAEERRELEQAQKLAEEQRLRAEEGEKAARGLRLRLILATIAVVVALIAFGAAVVLGLQSQNNANAAETSAVEADEQRDAALAASTAEAEQRATAEASAQEAQKQSNIAATAVVEADEQRDTALAASTAEAEQREAAEANEAEAVEQGRIGRRALARQLAADVNDILDIGDQGGVPDYDLAFLLAYEAVTITELTDSYVHEKAAQALFRAIETAPPWQMNLPRQRHSGPVWSASFNPDGDRIVTASEDGTAKVWDAGSGAELLTLSGHEGIVRSASFNPDGDRIVTASADGTAKVWDAGSGAELLTLSGHEGIVLSASFNPDGDRIVTASEDGTAKVWDAGSGAELLTLSGHEGIVRSASFNPDGDRIVTASADGTAKVWDAGSGAELLTLSGHEGIVLSASFNPDGDRIVTASEDGTAKVWDAGSGAELLTLSGHEGIVLSASFNPDGDRIVTASEDGTAKVWPAWADSLSELAEVLLDRVVQRYNPWLTPQERQEFELD